MSEMLDHDEIMSFGKHKGKRWGDVPEYYWKWFLGQKWCEEHPLMVNYANAVVEDT